MQPATSQISLSGPHLTKHSDDAKAAKMAGGFALSLKIGRAELNCSDECAREPCRNTTSIEIYFRSLGTTPISGKTLSE